MKKTQPSKKCRKCGAFVDPADIVNGICQQCYPNNVALKYTDPDDTRQLNPKVMERGNGE